MASLDPTEEMDTVEPDSTVQAPTVQAGECQIGSSSGGDLTSLSVGNTEKPAAPSEDPGHVQEATIEPPDDDDEARSEATFRFKVENFSSIKDSMLSEHCVIRNLPWKIMIMQRQTQTNDRNTKSVGYFLQV